MATARTERLILVVLLLLLVGSFFWRNQNQQTPLARRIVATADGLAFELQGIALPPQERIVGVLRDDRREENVKMISLTPASGQIVLKEGSRTSESNSQWVSDPQPTLETPGLYTAVVRIHFK